MSSVNKFERRKYPDVKKDKRKLHPKKLLKEKESEFSTAIRAFSTLNSL